MLGRWVIYRDRSQADEFSADNASRKGGFVQAFFFCGMNQSAFFFLGKFDT
jgi:hypothetical protein